jgi:serine/threonine protein phosphatase 1
MPTRTQNRVIAVGDIHGCSTALAALVGAVQPGPGDVVIPLGDVIDYGPDSRGVIEQLMALRERTTLLLLTGNHEEMLLAVLDQNRDLDSWTRHGGDRTLASYGVDHPRGLPAEDVAFLRTARWFHETETHSFVHAGYFPNQPLRDTPSSALFWESLDPNRAWPHYSGKTFVVGHTPQTTGDILDLGFVVGIDTDCSRGNWLTALDAVSGQYWQANQQGEVRTGRRKERV